MFPKSKDEIELEELIENQKSDLKRQFENSFRVNEESLRIILKAKSFAENSNEGLNMKFWNLAGFICIVSSDLKYAGFHLTVSKNPWEKRYFGRQVALIAYEATNDLFELLGTKFRESLKKIDRGNKYQSVLNSLTLKLNNYKAEYSKGLKEIRNVSIGHREQEISQQFEVIEQINWLEMIKMMKEFDEILNDLGSFSQSLLNGVK